MTNKNWRGLRVVLLTGTTMAGLSSAAWAQDEDKPVQLEPISIEAKADVLTGGVQVGEDALDRIQAQTIKDVFRQEPGVTVGSPSPIAQKVYLNGIEDTKAAVDVDGARQTTRTWHHIGTAIIDPGLLKSVKVENGVAPADAGPEAAAGSISYETKDGRDLVEEGNEYGGFGKLTWNSNGNAFTEDLAVATHQGAFDGLVYVNHASGANYTDGNGDEVPGTAPEMENAMVKLAYTGSSGYRLKLSTSYTRDDGVRPARPNFGRVVGSDPEWLDYNKQSVTVSLNDETPSDLINPNVSFSYTKAELDAELNGRNDVLADVKTMNGKLANTFTIDLGTITTGVDFYKDWGTGGPSNNPVWTEEVWNYGGFGQARLSVTETTRLSFGGRVDHNTLEGNDGTELENTGLGGNFNVEQDVADWFMAYGGLGTSRVGTPLTEIGIQNYFSQNWTYDDFEPSRSINYKAGGVVEFGRFSFDGHYFWTKLNNTHDIDNNERGTSFDVKSQGINAQATYQWTDGFVRASWTHATVRTDSGIPSSTSAYGGLLMGDLFAAEVAQNFPEYGIRTGFDVEGALENKDYEDSNGNRPLDGFLVANLNASWAPEDMDGVTLRLDVNSLFDQTYFDRANTGYDNTRTEPYKEPGRNFVVSAKFEM